MPSTSTYRGLTVPTVSGDTNVWGTELNTTIDALDTILGQTLTLYSSTSGNDITLSSSQGQSMRVYVNNTSSAAMQVNLPASNYCYGDFVFSYSSTYTSADLPLTITAGSSGTGGQVATMFQAANRLIFADGIDAWYGDEQLSGLAFSVDGGSEAPASGIKGYLKLPFGIILTGWDLVQDTSSGTQSWTITAYISSSPSGQVITGSSAPTATGDAGEYSGDCASWVTALPPYTTLSYTLNSPENFTKTTVTILGYKA